MTKNSLKVISIIFGIFAIHFTINLIPDKTKKTFTALDKNYSFKNEISVSEDFETDFESAYRIVFNFENTKDSLLPIKKKLEVLRNGKLVELYGNRNNRFVSKSGATYKLNLELENRNSSLNKFNIIIYEDSMPGPTYELLIEREFKWVFWTIDGILILISLIAGYFGFRQKASR